MAQSNRVLGYADFSDEQIDDALENIAEAEYRRLDEVEELEKHYRDSDTLFSALETDLGSHAKLLPLENLRVDTLRGDGSVMRIFRILRPTFMSRLADRYDKADMGTKRRILRCILPFVKRWRRLVALFEDYYSDKAIGETLAARFSNLQAQCKLFANDAFTASARIRGGKLFYEEAYIAAYKALTKFYEDELPNSANEMHEDPKAWEEIVVAATAFAYKTFKKLKGNTKSSEWLAACVREFYDDLTLWKKKNWIVGATRKAFDKTHTKAHTEEKACYNLYCNVRKRLNSQYQISVHDVVSP